MSALSTKSVQETRALAASLAELSRPGDLLLLVGELGAGKTAFAQGFGIGLGIDARITSPTFTLANEYRGGRLMLHHLDVYRLDQIAEVHDIGLPELLDEGGVTLIEWGDAITPALPADFLEVRLTFADADDDDHRSIELRVVGPTWSARARALQRATEPWTVSAC
jgi:tRNA threonylcarbamoyladenosine biosynthesis protein TsaE